MTCFDDVARYNQGRWEEMAAEGLKYTRPMLDLDPASALELVDSHGLAGDVAGKDVLCLAGAGGQQSAAFGLLGANVTVFDLTATQLERDREAAAHYGLEVRTVQGDMRDLSAFDDDSSTWSTRHTRSTSSPDPLPVFREAARVLRRRAVHAELLQPVRPRAATRWNGEGYVLNAALRGRGGRQPAILHWNFEGFDGSEKRVVGPREFRHTLGTLLNGLAGLGMVLIGLWEDGDVRYRPGARLLGGTSCRSPRPTYLGAAVDVAPPTTEGGESWQRHRRAAGRPSHLSPRRRATASSRRAATPSTRAWPRASR